MSGEALKGQTLLVTGATGFLGGVLALEAAERGAKVRALARSHQRGLFLDGVAGVRKVIGDVTRAARMRELCRGCDVVVHAAAAMGGPLDLQRRVNVEGTRKLTEAAAGAGVRRFVHVSTVMVYGYPHDRDVFEEDGPSPCHSPYSITKSEGEGAVRAVGAREGLSWCIIRPGAIYGPRSRSWTAGMFKRAARRFILWPGDGTGNYPAIHVDDVTDLCLVAATHPGADGQVFNAVMDPPPTARAYLESYARLVRKPRWLPIPVAPLHLVLRLLAGLSPRRSELRDTPDMLRFLHRCARFRMDRARDLLGWQHRVGLEEGIASCVPWLREKGLLREPELRFVRVDGGPSEHI